MNIFECEVRLSLCLLFGYGDSSPQGMRSVSRPDHFIPRERDLGAYGIGGWVYCGVGLDAFDRKVSSDCRESARCLVAMPTEP